MHSSPVPTFARPPIPAIVQQHAEESAMLRHVRSVLVRAPHVKLHQLRRLDDRIAAHLDGLAVAGDHGTACARAGLARGGAGEVFAAAVCALESQDDAALDKLASLAAAEPDAQRGLLSALGWVSAQQLQGTVRRMLAAPEPQRRAIGLGACRLHGVDPGLVLASALQDADAALRIQALRAAAELGRVDLLDAALALLGDAEPEVARHAAQAACLLGDRTTSLQWLEAAALREEIDDARSTLIVLQATRWERAVELVRTIARRSPEPQRRVIRACGWLGDVRLVPWLIELMPHDRFARIAGEAFSMITGADLAALDLERKPPQGLESGPTDDPEDDDVALDEDDSLPWPDAALVQRWWAAQAERWPAGTRSFVGAPATPAHCERVLREGYQRQRIAAALQRCLLQPGTPVFPVAAPAWRQQRRLA